jgi:SHS2 domain-containing protein
MNAGFREVPHTADWQLYVYGPDLAALLEQAATGMGTLAGVRVDGDKTQQLTLDLESPDPESLLVAFLSEILWLGEHDHLAFTQFNLTISEGETLHLHAEMIGGVRVAVEKEIKAVTWHKLAIQNTPGGLETNIVFDV